MYKEKNRQLSTSAIKKQLTELLDSYNWYSAERMLVLKILSNIKEAEWKELCNIEEAYNQGRADENNQKKD